MTEDRARQRLDSLVRAVARLREALAVPEADALALDGTLQRFEFTFELTWKALKDVLEVEGVTARTPREAFQEAYAAGWLDGDSLWLGMLADRNLAAHVYDEGSARAIYERVRGYLPALEALRRALDGRLGR